MMNDEVLTIFNNQQERIGTASRKEVHEKGYWHEAFHCWFVSRENDIDYIYFQIRSEQKQDYPGALDITAAGHLLHTETAEDGVREIHEELGVNISFDELLPLDVFKYEVSQPHYVDKEFAHVFLYYSSHPLSAFTLQQEEVSGLVKAPFSHFCELWLGNQTELTVEGITNKKEPIHRTAHKSEFAPHPEDYYKTIIACISQQLHSAEKA
ncbi:NUDIX hydrolase [Priestia aryabhattai]|uniref:NUDIX hydrolase n=1 Tax=Priestia aryabhattai TaxID=412384 RepID=UPI003531AE38